MFISGFISGLGVLPTFPDNAWFEWRIAMRTALRMLLLVLVWMPVASAHTDEYFDSIETPHGGQMRMAGPYHLELVVGHNELTVYVTDHGGNSIHSSGGSAKAIITTGKKRFVVVLSPAGDNVLKGSGEFKLGKSNTVSLMVVMPGQEPQRAKFSIKRSSSSKKKGSPAGQQHEHHHKP
jgi:hypothetical protein